MTAMDTTNPLSSLSDEELVSYRNVRERVKSGAKLDDLPDSALIHYKKVRDVVGGKVPAATDQTSQPPDDAATAMRSIQNIAHRQAPAPAVGDPNAGANPYRTIEGAAPSIPAPPPGWNPGTEPLSFYDVPVVGPVARAVQAGTETENERLARQYATPQLHGPAAGATQVARFAGGVLDPGGQVANSAAATFERGGSGIEAAASGGISAALNVARIPFLDPIERAGTNLVMRAAPDVVRKGAGLAARGVAAGVGLGEAQAIAEGVAGVPRAVGEQAAAGVDHPIAAAITDEINRLIAAQPEILRSGALGGIVGEAVIKGIGRVAGGRPAPSANRAQTPHTTESIGDNHPITTVSPDTARTSVSDTPSPQATTTDVVPTDTNGVTAKESAQSEQIPRNTSSDPAERYKGEDPSTTTNPDDTGRVGPPPETVANPPGLPKGEKQPWEYVSGVQDRSGFERGVIAAANDLPHGSTITDSETGLTWTVKKSVSSTGRESVEFEADAGGGASFYVERRRGGEWKVLGAPEGGAFSKTATVERGSSEGPRPEKSRTATPEVAGPDATPKVAPATPDVAPEPTEPGFWQSMRDRAQARIDERAAAQREAEAKFKGAGGRRGSGGSLDPQTIYDRAVILASHIGEAGAAGAKAIKAKAKELFGEAHPEVVRSAARLLRDSQGNDGQMDPARFEVAAAEAKGDMERAQRLEPNESADIREMMATRKGEADLKDAKTAFKEKMAAARAAAKAKREDAVATQKAAGDIATEKAETSADVREMMAKRAAEQAGREKLSAAGEKHRAEMDAKREKFADIVDSMKAKESLGQDIRKRLVELAKENLDPIDYRKVLPLIGRAKAKDPTAKNPSVIRDFHAGMLKIFDIADASNLKSARAELRDTVGKAKAKSTGPTLASAINQAMGVKGKPKEPFRTGRIGPSEVAKLRPDYKDAATDLVESTRSDYVAGANKIADFIRAEEVAGRSNAFSDEAIDLLRSTDGKLVEELTANQVRAVNEAIEHVAHLSDEANKAQVLGEKRDLDQLRSEVVQNVRDRWGVKEAKNPGKSDAPGAHLAQLGKDFLVTDQDTLSTMVATVAGKGTAAHQVMWENIAKGESAQRTLLRTLTDKTGLHQWTAADLAKVNKPREVKYSGGKVKLRGWEMMEIVAAWNDPNTRKELETAGFVRQQDRGRSDKILHFTDRDITAIEAAMTAKERGAIDPMRAAMKEGFDAANDAHERMHGFRMPDEANHWSRTRDLAATERTVSGTLDQKARQNHWFEDAGIFKNRSSSKAAIVIRNPFEWVPAQLHTLTGMAHLAEPVRAARKVMADPAVKNEFAAKGGDSFVKTFEERLASVAGLPAESSTVNRIGQQFLGLRARSKLAFRISSVVKQKLGFLQAMSAVTDGGLRARMLKQALNPINLTPGERARVRAEINPRSGYLADRADPAYAASVASAANPDLRTSSSAVVRGYQAVERAGLAPLQFADGDVVIGVYKAVKGHYEAKGLTGDALLDKATWETEKIIRESQNPTSALDMSGFHLTGRRNAWVGMMTLFTSSNNKIRNQMRVAASDYAADPSPANRKQLAQTAALTAGNAVASKLMSSLLSGKTIAATIAAMTGAYLKEDKKDTYTRAALDALADLGDTAAPFGGEPIRAILNKQVGSGTWIRNVLSSSVAAWKQAEKDGSILTPEVAKKVVRMLRSGEVLPDAPLDYAGQVIRGVAGD